MGTNNVLNANSAGVVAYDGAGNFSASAITNHNVLVAGTSNSITSVAPGAAGTALCGNGASSNPSFQSVAGVGSTVTQHYSLVGGASNSLVSVSPSTAGLVLTSNGVSADPSFQSITTKGSFTPGIQFGGASVGVVYTNQVGQYTQIGNAVFFAIVILLSSKGSSSGVATISGLPVALGALEQCISVADPIVTFSGGNYNVFLDSAGFGGTTNIGLWQGPVATGQMTNANFSNTSRLETNGFYLI